MIIFELKELNLELNEIVKYFCNNIDGLVYDYNKTKKVWCILDIFSNKENEIFNFIKENLKDIEYTRLQRKNNSFVKEKFTNIILFNDSLANNKQKTKNELILELNTLNYLYNSNLSFDTFELIH